MQDDFDIINDSRSSSSLLSSGITSTPLPCAGPSENSDFRYNQSSTSTSSSKSRYPVPPPVSVPSAAVPSSSQSMGQNQSTIAASSSAGHKFKRAFSRRKKLEEASKEGDYQESPPPSPSPVSRFFGYRKVTPPTPPSPSFIPPPLPPRPPVVHIETKSQEPIDDHPKPVIFNGPGVSASVQVTRQDEGGNKTEELGITSGMDHLAEQVKEDWRKSDATMASLSTIRPEADSSQDARPLSVAESSHSTNTIVAVSKRLSILVADAELPTPGERDVDSGAVASRPQSPTSPLGTQHRRSVSLKLGTVLSFTSRGSLSESHIKPPKDLPPPLPPRPKEPLHVSHTSDTPKLTIAAAEGFISPLNSDARSSRPTRDQVRGHIAAWAPAPVPPSGPPSSFKGPPQSFRQTAVSISGSIAPAAMDLGKRAMEKMGRAWGSRGTGSPLRHDGSLPNEQLAKRGAADPAAGLHPNDSIPIQMTSVPITGKGKRRTPNAPSGSWSIASSASSVSELEPCPALAAINESKCLRGPLSSGGLVFGRRLADCVRDTAIDEVRLRLISGEYFDQELGNSSNEQSQSVSPMQPLEQRLLPAIVVRCVQHLLTWGVQEEGLFRMNGRSAHIRELRGEFDQGADYDISKCAPYDIDPHVVSSLFKLYLREIPEQLLTNELLPYFEAVMAAEDVSNSDVAQNLLASATALRSGMAIRKPPSLSTLAMPNLAKMRSFSPSLINGIAALLSQLPRENRDLLYTVTELMKMTASRSKETKMPLANLLLVFCPSLNMKPSLLRILCESDDVWSLPTNAVDDPNLDITVSDQHSVSDLESNPESTDDSLRLDDSALGHPVGMRRDMRRGPVATLYRNITCSSSLTASSDSTSYTDDASEPSLQEASHTENRVIQNVSPPLSSSVESLATPSTSSDIPSFDFSHTKNDSFTTPAIADYTQLSLHPSSRSMLSSPIPFPSSTTSLSTPLLPSGNLSMPALDPVSGSPRLKRASRPSLHLLFSKKSVPSLPSFSSTISSPLPYQRPQPSADGRALSLPVLDTPMSSPAHACFQGKDFTQTSTLRISPILQSRSMSSTITDSPVSAMYGTPSSSSPALSTARPNDTEFAFTRSASRLTLAIGRNDTADDWMKSVLKAVDIDNEQSLVNDRVKFTTL